MQEKAYKSYLCLTLHKVRSSSSAFKLSPDFKITAVSSQLKAVTSVVITLVTNPEIIPGIATTPVI